MRVIRCKDLEAIYCVCVKRAGNYQGNGYSYLHLYGLAPYVYHADTGERLVLTCAHETDIKYIDIMKYLVSKGVKVSIRL